MNIASSAAVQSITFAARSDIADDVNLLVLKKTLDMQASLATTMLQEMQKPPLASEGAVGTQVNTAA